MPQITVNSSSITTFGWSVNMDIFSRTITFNLLPFTTGPNLANRPVAFSVVDEDGVTLASINFATPQIPNAGATTSWVLDLSSVNFAFLFQTYKIIAAIQDIDGSVYQTDPIYPKICQPTDLTDSGYVPGLFQITPDCINSILTVKEITALVYNSLQPTSVTKSGVLNYPTGTIAPVPFSGTPFSNNVIYTGQYNIKCTTIATYALGQDVYVLVSYITNNVFPVICSNKMSSVVCCITKLQQTAIKNCNNAVGENARQQLSDVSVYVMNGLLKEISGQDSTFEVEYIRKFLSCDCGSSSLSQTEFTPINPAVTSIVLQGVGGTSVGSPTVTGNTKTFPISSNVYQVVKGDTGDLAFTIQADTSVPNTVKYIITFNYDTMAGYILTAIQNDPSLQAQLNSLVQATGVNLQGLNGKCVIDLTQTNYSLSQAITNATIVTNIVINGNNFAAPSNLFANNPTAVAAWLNGLTLGAFSATVTSGILTVLSLNNTNAVSTLTFTGPNVTQLFQASNDTLVQVLQAIINYLCNLTDLQIALFNNLSICTLDYNGNVVTTNYPAGTKQSSFNASISNAICNICSRISTLTGMTCTKLQALFSDNPNVQFNNASDRYLSVVAGGCTTLTGKQQALAFIAAINAYSDVKAAFCAIDCSAPGTCPGISNANFAATGQTSIGFYGVTFSPATIANQTVTLLYRVTGTTTWTTASTNINLFPNGNINGTSPFQITGLTPGVTYDLSVGNNCGTTPFVTQVTTPTTAVISGVFLLDNIIYNICGDSGTTLYSSVPFATGVTMFTNAGLTTPVTGFSLIVQVGTGSIYHINSSTGVVGTNTGSNCASGTSGSYILGNNAGTICGGAIVTLYTNGAFAVSGILYLDAGLTTPVTGNLFVVNQADQNIYNLNNTTGVIGATTGASCATTVTVRNALAFLSFSAVTGITGFTFTPAAGAFTQNGTHSTFTGAITVNFSGSIPSSPPFNIQLIRNGIVIDCRNFTGGSSGSGSFTFGSFTYNASDTILLDIGTGSC